MKVTQIDCYTDGAHYGEKKAGCGTVSLGGVLYDVDGTEYTFSQVLDQEHWFSMYGLYPSNPTAELYALTKLLSFIRHAKNIEFNVYSDYKGCQMWPLKMWKAKKQYIIDILQYTFGYMEDLANNGNKLNLLHIRGHQGIEGNERADELCKIAPHNNLQEWVDKQQ